MKNSRPYWKVIVSLTFSLLATILFVVLGLKFLRFFMPFVLGWIIAWIANPMVCWLEKHVKIVKKLGSAIIIILVLGGVVGILYLAISKIVHEVLAFIGDAPALYGMLETEIVQLGDRFAGLISLLPEQARSALGTLVNGFEEALGNWVGNLSEPTVEAAGNIAKSVPSVFIGFIVMIVSAYFFVADRENVIAWLKKIAPESVESRMKMVMDTMTVAVGGYFKAQFQIMLVLSTILFIGFMILGINYAILLAIFIAFLDFLPFFGTAVTLLPWAAYCVIDGHYKVAIGLVILYVVTQLTRQVIQPKLVGDRVGLKPLATLFFLYIGYRIGSVLGLIFAVPVGMIILNMYEAGAFDYILDDVKILVHGILELRR